MDRVAFAFYQALAAVLRRLPIAFVCRTGWALGALGYWIAGPYRRLVLHNLHIAFRAEKSGGELRTIARKHFASLGSNLLASIKVPALSRGEIERAVQIEGLEIVHALNARGRGIVLVISHIGNWEVLAQITVIAFRSAIGTVFQRLGNVHLDAAFRKNRATLGCELFERKEGFQGALKMLRAGGSVGVLMDQHAGDAGVWCPFFGRLASTSSLPAMLALRSGAALVPAAVHSAGPGRWRLVIDSPVELRTREANEVTAQLNETLERQIRRQPEDWFWVHNRWKTPKPKFLLATYKRGVFIPAGAGPDRTLQPFNILIRASNWLGDAIMSVPAVRAIKRGRPDARITILTPAKLADVWKSVAEVSEIIVIEPGESVFAVAGKIRRGFDAAVIFPNSLRTALEPWLAGIPRRVGYPGHQRRWLLNQIFEAKKKKKKETAPPPRHQIHHYLALAEFIGAEVDGGLSMVDGPRGGAAVRTRPVIGLCPGAEYGPAKRWLPERFAEVVRAVRERTQCEWKIFGVEKDRPVADAILAAADVPCTDLVGKTTLAQLMDELRSCDVLLSNDTGTMHLAAFLGVQTVALFGSTEPALTGPLGEGHRVIRHHVECSPCFLRECPIDFRCMKAIEAAEVTAAIEAILKTTMSPA
jgi:lipopolysaccharide heptosyltransferase II